MKVRPSSFATGVLAPTGVIISSASTDSLTVLACGYRIEIICQIGTLSTILQHFTYNEIQWPTAVRRWHLALRDPKNIHTFVKKWNDTTMQLQLPSNLREPGDWYNRTIWSIFCKHSSCCTRGGQINDSCSPDSIRSLNSWNCCSLSGIHSKIIQLMRFKEIFKESFVPKTSLSLSGEVAHGLDTM